MCRIRVLCNEEFCQCSSPSMFILLVNIEQTIRLEIYMDKLVNSRDMHDILMSLSFCISMTPIGLT